MFSPYKWSDILNIYQVTENISAEILLYNYTAAYHNYITPFINIGDTAIMVVSADK